MVLKGKLIAEVEMRSSGDLFHDLFATMPHKIATMSPNHIQSCAVQDGEFGNPGSTILWNYTLDGKACVAKEVIESIDVENKTITYNVIGGDIRDEYTSFVIHIYVTTIKGDNLNNRVKWVFEYEKLHERILHPTQLLDFVVNVTKNVEEHYLNNPGLQTNI